jgi:NAD(P)-dependent dehydrogenase (short-subunit alcohol dehydrogenase family)
MKLTGKRALITGGNSGIGLATARLFISEGAGVAITGRDQQTLDEAVAELGSKAHGYRANVRLRRTARSSSLISPKTLANLTSSSPMQAFLAGRRLARPTKPSSRRSSTPTSTVLSILSIQPLLSWTTTAGIVFNGSVHTYLGQPGLAAYAAMKGGFVSMARSIAADLAPRKIRVNGWPGSDRDSHLEARAARQCYSRGSRKTFRLLLLHGSTWPLGQAGRSGQGGAFPCLGDSSYINAVELMVDDGLTGAPFGAPLLRG